MQGYSGNTVVRKPDPDRCQRCGDHKRDHIVLLDADGMFIYVCQKIAFKPEA